MDIKSCTKTIIFMFALFIGTYLFIGIVMYVAYFHVALDFLYVLCNSSIVIALGSSFGASVSIFGGLMYAEHQQTKNKKK